MRPARLPMLAVAIRSRWTWWGVFPATFAGAEATVYRIGPLQIIRFDYGRMIDLAAIVSPTGEVGRDRLVRFIRCDGTVGESYEL